VKRLAFDGAESHRRKSKYESDHLVGCCVL
jgi:hypothetical protein